MHRISIRYLPLLAFATTVLMWCWAFLLTFSWAVIAIEAALGILDSERSPLEIILGW
jgi:hypothetical protein